MIFILANELSNYFEAIRHKKLYLTLQTCNYIQL